MDDPKETQDTETSETTEGTSDKDPETFTKEDVRKARSDALAEVGRHKKAAEDAIKALKATNTRIDQMVKDQEDAELEDAKDDTEKLSAIKERQGKRRAEAELAKVKQESAEKDEKIKLLDEKEVESTKERNAREIASRLGVDAKRLANLAKYTDGSTEAIEEIAKDLPKKEVKTPLKVDSSKTVGAGGRLRYKDVEEYSTEGKTTQQIMKDAEEMAKQFTKGG